MPKQPTKTRPTSARTTTPKLGPTRPGGFAHRKTKPELHFEPVTEADEKVKVLYYGEPGTGKTTAVASLAKLGLVIHVDAEAGVKARPLRALGVPIDRIKKFRDIDYAHLDALFWQLKGDLADGKGPIGVVWDSTTEIQVKLLEQTVEQQYEKALMQNKARDPFDVYLEDFGTNTGEMRALVRKFRDLPCHVALACLERRTQDKDSGEVQVGPDLTPKLARDVLGYMDIIVHSVVHNEDEYIGITRPAGKFTGKDRFGILPRRMINPTMDRIVAYVTGGLSRDTDEEQLEAEERWRAERRQQTSQGGTARRTK